MESAIKNWYDKARTLASAIYRSVEEERNRPGGNKNYRGLEHRWYAVWIAVLSAICSRKKTLAILAQPRISRVLYDNDDQETQNCRFPDLGLVRLIGSQTVIRNHRLFSTVPYEKYVVLMENKRLPEKRTRMSRRSALNEARNDLLVQVEIFFDGDPIDDSEKAVIGVSAAGDFWSWELFTPDDFSSKPLSKNRDGTFRPEQPKKTVRPHVKSRVPNYYKLFMEESDEALDAMMTAIRDLPCSIHFSDSL